TPVTANIANRTQKPPPHSPPSVANFSDEKNAPSPMPMLAAMLAASDTLAKSRSTATRACSRCCRSCLVRSLIASQAHGVRVPVKGFWKGLGCSNGDHLAIPMISALRPSRPLGGRPPSGRLGNIRKMLLLLLPALFRFLDVQIQIAFQAGLQLQALLE